MIKDSPTLYSLWRVELRECELVCEVVLEWTCQDIFSARTTQYDIWVLYCIVWRFAWIRNRQYRQLRRLCCEILTHSVLSATT